MHGSKAVEAWRGARVTGAGRSTGQSTKRTVRRVPPFLLPGLSHHTRTSGYSLMYLTDEHTLGRFLWRSAALLFHCGFKWEKLVTRSRKSEGRKGTGEPLAVVTASRCKRRPQGMCYDIDSTFRLKWFLKDRTP